MELARVDVSAEVAEIAKTGYLGIQEQKRSGRHENSSIERGTYVPDDAHIDICLNCTRKKCTTGNCKLMSKNTRKRS
jgi:hypothetical protein